MIVKPKKVSIMAVLALNTTPHQTMTARTLFSDKPTIGDRSSLMWHLRFPLFVYFGKSSLCTVSVDKNSVYILSLAYTAEKMRMLYK